MKIKLADLERVVRKAILHYGYNQEESEVIFEVLLYAQLRGNNQGIVKLVGEGIPKDPEAGEITIERDNRLSSLINGNKRHGMLVMKEAVNIVLNKVQNHGFGIVGTYNTHTSTGAIGYYAEKIADNGFLGFVLAGSPPLVCPYGSYEQLFGTNPLAVGIPTNKSPLVFDMATSAITYFGLIEALTANRSIPNNVAYNNNGELTIDPMEALQGAVLPFDRSYKGSGLSLIIEILTGPLVGASFVGIGDATGNWGNLVIAIDPDLLTGREEFDANVTRIIDKVKSAKKLPGINDIYLPGERENQLVKMIIKNGEIEVEDNLYQELQNVANIE